WIHLMNWSLSVSGTPSMWAITLTGMCLAYCCAASWRPPASILDDLNRQLGAVGNGKPCLLRKSRRHAAIAHGACVAKTVEYKQLGRHRLAAVVALAFLGVDADPHRFLHRSRNVSNLADTSGAGRVFWASWSISS